MTEPELVDAGGRAAVRIERDYPHPVERVWAAVTQPEHLATWFPTKVTVELRAGGTVRYEWEGGEADGADPRFGEVLEIDPPRLLAFTWGADHLRFELEPHAGGTRFVLEHAFDDRAGAASFGAGWEGCLAALGPVLADEEPPAPDRMVDRHEELVARFGLDRPTVEDAPGGWTITWERQLTCPAEVAWDLFPGVLGTVTEVDAPRLLAFDVAPDEPGRHVRLELGDGTGHGARLVLTVAGGPEQRAELPAAEEQWGTGAIAHVAREAAAWAHANPPTPA